MAATKYNCRIDTRENEITDIKAALNAKSLITEVKYEANGYLIFTSPITPKVLKIKLEDKNNFYFYHGTAWTSGTTITDAVQFAYSQDAAVNALTVIADAGYFAIIYQNYYTAMLAYVGALDNADVVHFGFTSRNDGSSYNNNHCYNITQNYEMFTAAFSGNKGFKDGSGNFLTFPLMWAKADNTLMMNGAAIAITPGVKVSSVVSISGGTYPTPIVVGTNYILLPKPYYYHGYSGSDALMSSLLVEFTP